MCQIRKISSYLAHWVTNKVSYSDMISRLLFERCIGLCSSSMRNSQSLAWFRNIILYYCSTCTCCFLHAFPSLVRNLMVGTFSWLVTRDRLVLASVMQGRRPSATVLVFGDIASYIFHMGGGGLTEIQVGDEVEVVQCPFNIDLGFVCQF